MGRKDRNLAGFNDVVDDNINNKANVNNNDKNDNESHDDLDKVLESKKTKDQTHIMKGIYFEKEVARAIDRVARGRGKGAKSEIVNAAVKKVFKEKGWM